MKKSYMVMSEFADSLDVSYQAVNYHIEKNEDIKKEVKEIDGKKAISSEGQKKIINKMSKNKIDNQAEILLRNINIQYQEERESLVEQVKKKDEQIKSLLKEVDSLITNRDENIEETNDLNNKVSSLETKVNEIENNLTEEDLIDRLREVEERFSEIRKEINVYLFIGIGFFILIILMILIF